MEISFNIASFDKVSFLGVNNTNFAYLASRFSKLKLVNRGDEIIAIGDDDTVSVFNDLMERIVQHFETYQHLDTTTIEDLMNGDAARLSSNDKNIILFGNKGKVIKSRTQNQEKLVKYSEKNDLVLAIGPAGTGKTYVAIALAVCALKNREVQKIILTRPAVEAGEQLGFLPGDMKEKLDPYLQPLYDALADMLPPKKLAEMYADRTLEIAPLAYMRGRTLENAFVILDEAQNTSINQIKMFLTRMGEHSKFIITGDITQIDLPKNQISGLKHAVKVLEPLKEVSFVFFDKADIVRHKLVKKILGEYEKKEINHA